jgi:hypothetical protein
VEVENQAGVNKVRVFCSRVRACLKNRLEGDCERGGADGEARRWSIF